MVVPAKVLTGVKITVPFACTVYVPSAFVRVLPPLLTVPPAVRITEVVSMGSVLAVSFVAPSRVTGVFLGVVLLSFTATGGVMALTVTVRLAGLLVCPAASTKVYSTGLRVPVLPRAGVKSTVPSVRMAYTPSALVRVLPPLLTTLPVGCPVAGNSRLVRTLPVPRSLFRTGTFTRVLGAVVMVSLVATGVT